MLGQRNITTQNHYSPSAMFNQWENEFGNQLATSLKIYSKIKYIAFNLYFNTSQPWLLQNSIQTLLQVQKSL